VQSLTLKDDPKFISIQKTFETYNQEVCCIVTQGALAASQSSRRVASEKSGDGIDAQISENHDAGSWCRKQKGHLGYFLLLADQASQPEKPKKIRLAAKQINQTDRRPTSTFTSKFNRPGVAEH